MATKKKYVESTERRDRKVWIAPENLRDAAEQLRSIAKKCDELAAEMDQDKDFLPIEYDGGSKISDAVATAWEWYGVIQAKHIARTTAKKLMPRPSTAAPKAKS